MLLYDIARYFDLLVVTCSCSVSEGLEVLMNVSFGQKLFGVWDE